MSRSAEIFVLSDYSRRTDCSSLKKRVTKNISSNGGFYDVIKGRFTKGIENSGSFRPVLHLREKTAPNYDLLQMSHMRHAVLYGSL